jgi:D-alanyl-lipoteichoic acid acyltransferase DltB (MBOAT superfamily)
MTIASFAFLAFALAVVLVYNANAGIGWRKWTLFLANLCFLSTFTHSLTAFIPLAAFLAFGYLSVRLMQRPHSSKLYYGIAIATVLIFFWLKKYTFLPQQSFLHFVYTTIGLSYIFFRVLHLIIIAHGDTAGGGNNLGGKVSPLAYLNFTLNFTTLVAGPIQRYPDFITQHLAPQRPPLTLFITGEALERIILGFFKVNVMGLALSTLQGHAINILAPTQPLAARAITTAIIAASYTLYLYFNFSGYTDIVIGVALFLRIRLPENFNRPFLADNFLDFWSRWHITLSQWLKTYVYNPLLLTLVSNAGSPALGPFFGVAAYFVTFFLVGLWHGQTSVFLFFGVLQGAGVSVNKLYQIQAAKLLGKKRYKDLSANWLYQTICRGITFTFFTFSLLWFWSNWHSLGVMAHAAGLHAQLLAWLLIFIASTILLTAWQVIRDYAVSVKLHGRSILLTRYVRTAWATVLVFLAVAVVELLSTPAPDIVYKTF